MEKDAGALKENELAAINRYTRRELREEDVYAFSLILCDNDIDRDLERFSDEALDTLSELFVGVTGIADHDPKTKNQSARIFSCSVEEVQGRMTSDGLPYRRLCARAYLSRSVQNQEMILALDSGIRKEVSIGCSVKHRICSICGEDISECQHIKGRKYGNRLCFAELREVTDAYEWSFVAVPAQKAAGVTKGYRGQTDPVNKTVCPDRMIGDRKGVTMELEKKLFSATKQEFSAGEIQELAERFRKLQKSAEDGRMYREMLMKEIRKTSALALPELTAETIVKMAEGLTVRELNELNKALRNKAEDVLPMTPQLYKAGKTQGGNENYSNI